MKVIFSTEDINSYGFWVKTSGIDLKRFKKNPVLTFNHNTYGMSVGKVKNIKVENNQLVGEIEFDVEDEKGKELQRKYEKGYMNGFSVGIRPLKWSEDAADLKKGQSRQTVTKCELIEIAAATVPSNSNAVSLYDSHGNEIELSTGSANNLPSINNKNNMEKTALALGLAADASEKEVLEAILKLKTEQLSAVNAKLEAEKTSKALQKASIEALIATGKEKGIVTDESEATYRKLAANDFNLASDLINKVAKPVKASGTKKDLSIAAELAKLNKGNSDGEKIKLLNEMTEDEVLNLREKDKEEYKKRFRLTYGTTPTLE